MTRPFVSCITPTRNRRRFIPGLIRMFLEQDYPNRELLIVEDGAEDCSDLIPSDGRVRYFRLDGSIGAKLNFAVQRARGEICLRMDDDDWQMPNRISAQVAHLQLSGKPVVGLSSAIFYTEGQEYGIEIIDEPMHIMGFSQCFLRQYAIEHPYEDISLGEDMLFSRAAYKRGDLSTLGGVTCMIARDHDSNTSPRNSYLKDPVGSQLAAIFGEPDNYRRIPLSQFAATVGR